VQFLAQQVARRQLGQVGGDADERKTNYETD
jgi:hypothetical protein